MSKKERYQYWDSSVFCSYFSEEAERCSVVEELLIEARAGRLKIITSSFTLTEVLRCKGHEPITAEQEEKLTLFFEYPFIVIVEAGRDVCERARHYVWKHGFKPKDAVHVASAEFAARMAVVDELFSWDADFVKRNGTVDLKIPFSRPYMAQPNIPGLYDGTEDERDTGEQSSAAGAPQAMEDEP